MSNYGKPTPGPWKIDNSRGLQIVTSDGKTVIARVAAHKKVEWRCHSTTNTDNFTRHANARLIAAAPDLLQAAEEVINLDGFVPNTISPEAKHVLLKAIQKARGLLSLARTCERL